MHHQPKLLDLYGGAQGAGVGYARAGWHVTSIDNKQFTRHPEIAEVITADALTVLCDPAYLQRFDLVHTSPPCQAYTPLGALHPHIGYPDLVAATRELLEASGLPWVIENVMSAPLRRDRSIVLCGGMFGLRTYRHRRFELSDELAAEAPEHPKHVVRTATRRRRERWAQGWHVSITGDVGTYVGPEAMGIDWMNGNDLSQAIPPAYTQYLGEQLLALITT